MLLKGIGDLGFLRNFFAKGRHEFYAKRLEEIAYSRIKEVFGLKSVPDWKVACLLSQKPRVLSENISTQIVTYQNRYELYKSMSVSASILLLIEILGIGYVIHKFTL